MKWCGVVLLVLCVCASVWGGKWGMKFGKIGGRGGGSKKTPSQPKYPRQPPPSSFDSRPPSYNPSWNHDSKPPPYNPSYNRPPAPGWNVQTNQGYGGNHQPSAPGWKQPPPSYNPGPPPPYSKNPAPYPQSGGHANPPPFSQYPQYGHYPQSGSYPGHSGYPQGSYTGYGGYSQGSYNQFPQYPQSYGGGGYDYKKKKGWNMPGIIPIPIPIPLGGGGLGYGSLGSGFYRPKGNSIDKENDEDEKKRPRIIVPSDLELDGVTELPAGSPIGPWDFVGKEKLIRESKKRSDELIEEFGDK